MNASQTTQVLQAFEDGQAITYREVCDATGFTLKRVITYCDRLRTRQLIERANAGYPATNRITHAGLAHLTGTTAHFAPGERVTMVEHALRTRHPLETVFFTTTRSPVLRTALASRSALETAWGSVSDRHVAGMDSTMGALA